jgi:thioredoxin 1
MKIVGFVVLGIALLLWLMQLSVRWRMRRLQGKPAPEISGDVGDALKRNERALLYFYSPTCGPCRAMTPVVEQLASRHQNVVKVDVSDSAEVARSFGVMATPTTILVEQGKVAKVRVGSLSEKQLESLLQ